MLAEQIRLKRNFATLLTAQFYTQALATIGGIIVVRWLGPVEYGRYTLAVAALNLGAIVADGGLSAYVGREAARREAAESLKLWRTAIKLRLGLSLLVWLASIGLTLFTTGLGSPELVALAGLTLFPLTAVILTTAFLNGQGRAPLSAALNAGIGTLGFGLLLVGLVWQATAAVALIANLCANVVGAGLLLWLSRAHLPNNQAENVPALRLLKLSRSFWLIGLAAVFFQYADTFVVSILLGEKLVGQYGAALRLLTLMTVIPTVWGIAATSRFAREPHQKHNELIRWGWLLTAGGVGLALLTMILAVPVVNLLLGERYAQAAHILSWLGWAGAAIFASAAPVTWLTIINKQHLILVALVCADAIGLLLSLILSGWLGWGIEGIALARLAASWMLCGLYIVLGGFFTKI